MSERYVLEIPEQIHIEVSPKRRPQAAIRPWPAGTSIQAVIDATSVENAQKIVGRTALELFRMD